MKYDFIVVGAGLFGSVFAAEAVDAGKRVLVLDRRNYVGGFCNSYEDPSTGIEVHRHGTHAFHTDDARVWGWLNQYTPFYPYHHRVMARVGRNRVIELPVNLSAFELLYDGFRYPSVAADLIASWPKFDPPRNFAEAAISKVGSTFYQMFVEGYTRKHWGCDPWELPASLAARLHIRTTYRTGYFTDRYQGVPECGYGKMFEKMLEGADVVLGAEVDQDKLDDLRSNSGALVWTGPLDDFYGRDLGRLGWRSVRLLTRVLQQDDYQGCAQMNDPSEEVNWTREHEPKHMRPDRWVKGQTVVQTEFPGDDPDNPAYPMRRLADVELFGKYRERAISEKNVIFGGRLASYVYYDMHQVVAQALRVAAEALS